VEFLTEVTITVPDGTPQDAVRAATDAEGRRARELAEQGHLLRIWRPHRPGWTNVGLWQAADEAELRTVLASLPLYPWMSIDIRPLDPHPSDPRHRRPTPTPDSQAQHPYPR
jgi:muconolactone D-isomerase